VNIPIRAWGLCPDHGLTGKIHNGKARPGAEWIVNETRRLTNSELRLTAAFHLSCLSKKGQIVGLASSQWSVALGFCPFGRVLCSTADNVLPDSGVCSPRFHRRGIPPSPPLPFLPPLSAFIPN
jgi:hypothetical protein